MSLTKTVNGTTYELLRYPLKTMNITQGNNGSFSHKGVNALDDAGKDTGIDPTYAPCKLKYVGCDSYTNGNAIFMESVNKVLFADGTIDYASFMFLHDNDISDIKAWAAAGKTWDQWQEMGDEGTAGYATGNHCHLEVKKGKLTWNKYNAYGYYNKNSYGTWFLQDSISADKAFAVDGVTIKNGNGMSWKKAADIAVASSTTTTSTTTTSSSSSAIPSGFTAEKGTFTLTVDKIYVRDKPSTSGTAVANYTKGQSVTYDCYKADRNGYVWISYIGSSGNRRYMACGVSRNYVNVTPYGTFK